MGELFFYKTDNKKMILDPSSQLIWKVCENLETLEKISEGKYQILEFYKRIQQEDKKEAEEIHSSLKKLISYGFFKNNEYKTQNILSNEFNHIVINPTTKCNLDCWYCYSKEYRTNSTEEISFEEIEKTILYFAERKKENQSKTPLSISSFLLSEVTLNFQTFLEIHNFVEKIENKYDFDILVFPPPTNLQKTDQDFIEYINDYGFLTVSIDYDNPNQIQDVLRNIKVFDNNVVKHCIIPLHSGMSKLVDIYLEFMKVFDYVSLRPVRIGENSKHPWGIDSSKALDFELRALCNKLIDMQEDALSNFLLSLGPSDYFNRYVQRIISRSKHVNRCPAGINALAVGPDSNFYPCSGFIGRNNFVLGSIKTGINLESISEYHNKSNVNTRCRNCSIRFYCGGFCEDWKQMLGNKHEIECDINYTFFKNSSFFVFELLEKKDNIIFTYMKEKGIDFRLSYPLDFEDFVSLFSAANLNQPWE